MRRINELLNVYVQIPESPSMSRSPDSTSAWRHCKDSGQWYVARQSLTHLALHKSIRSSLSHLNLSACAGGGVLFCRRTQQIRLLSAETVASDLPFQVQVRRLSTKHRSLLEHRLSHQTT